jgi:hypothetical protein
MGKIGCQFLLPGYGEEKIPPVVCFAVLSFSMEETCISGVGDLDKKSHLPAILCSGFFFFFFSPCNQIRH